MKRYETVNATEKETLKYVWNRREQSEVVVTPQNLRD